MVAGGKAERDRRSPVQACKRTYGARTFVLFHHRSAIISTCLLALLVAAGLVIWNESQRRTLLPSHSQLVKTGIAQKPLSIRDGQRSQFSISRILPLIQRSTATTSLYVLAWRSRGSATPCFAREGVTTCTSGSQTSVVSPGSRTAMIGKTEDEPVSTSPPLSLLRMQHERCGDHSLLQLPRPNCDLRELGQASVHDNFAIVYELMDLKLAPWPDDGEHDSARVRPLSFCFCTPCGRMLPDTSHKSLSSSSLMSAR